MMREKESTTIPERERERERERKAEWRKWVILIDVRLSTRSERSPVARERERERERVNYSLERKESLRAGGEGGRTGVSRDRRDRETGGRRESGTLREN